MLSAEGYNGQQYCTVKKFGYFGTGIARYLGITTPAVNLGVNSEEVPVVKKEGMEIIFCESN